MSADEYCTMQNESASPTCTEVQSELVQCFASNDVGTTKSENFRQPRPIRGYKRKAATFLSTQSQESASMILAKDSTNGNEGTDQNAEICLANFDKKYSPDEIFMFNTSKENVIELHESQVVDELEKINGNPNNKHQHQGFYGNTYFSKPTCSRPSKVSAEPTMSTTIHRTSPQAGKLKNSQQNRCHQTSKAGSETVSLLKKKRNEGRNQRHHATVFRSEKQEILHFSHYNLAVNLMEKFDSLLDDAIVQALSQLGWEVPLLSQKLFIPTIIKGYNVVSVQSDSTGTREALLAALATKLRNPLYVDIWQKKSHRGPLCIFVCATSNKALAIAHQLKEFLTPTKVFTEEEMPVVKYMGCGDKDLLIKLMEMHTRCTVLVTTPNCITRLMCFGDNEWSFSSVKVLILEEIDVLLKLYRVQTHQIVNGVRIANEFDYTQVLAVANKWTKPLRYLIRWFINDPVFMITAGFNVLAACRIHTIMLAISPELDRLKLSCSILAKEADKKRIVISCSGDDEASEACHGLQGIAKYKILCATSQMTSEQIKEEFKEWAARSMPVLVLSDKVLELCNIENANVLLHYSLPDTKIQFESRLKCMYRELNHPFSTVQQANNLPKVYVIVDNYDKKKLPAFQELLKNTHGLIPKWIQDGAKEQQRTREDSKVMRQVCPSLCQVGFCSKQETCNFKHYLRGTFEESISGNKMVEVEILEVNSATHFTVHILNPRNSEEVIAHSTLSKEMNAYYADSNREKLSQQELTTGQWCAVEHAKNYVRARLVCKSGINTVDAVSSKWSVTALDAGWSMHVESVSLLKLPKQFMSLKPRALNLYISNIQPPDFEPSWNPQQCQQVKRWFDVKTGAPRHCCCQIEAIMENVLWVTDLLVKPSQYGHQSSSETWSLRHHLMLHLSAMENCFIMQRVKEMYYLAQKQDSIDADVVSLNEETLLKVPTNDRTTSEMIIHKNDTTKEVTKMLQPTQVTETMLQPTQVIETMLQPTQLTETMLQPTQLTETMLQPEQKIVTTCQEIECLVNKPADLFNEASKPSTPFEEENFEIDFDELERFCDEEPDALDVMVEELQTIAMLKNSENIHLVKKKLKRGFLTSKPVESGVPNESPPEMSCMGIAKEVEEKKIKSTSTSPVMLIDFNENSTITENNSTSNVIEMSDIVSDQLHLNRQTLGEQKPVTSKPDISTSHVIPSIEWTQKDDCIAVKVLLEDLDDYSVQLEPQHLKIICNQGDQNYEYSRKLFERVCPELSFMVKGKFFLKLILHIQEKNVKWQQLAFERDEPCVLKTVFEKLNIDDFHCEWICLKKNSQL